MSEHEATFTDAMKAAMIFGLHHNTGAKELGGGIALDFVDDVHSVHLRVVESTAVLVHVTLYPNRDDGGARHEETIRTWKTHHELADRIDEVYQRALAGSL